MHVHVTCITSFQVTNCAILNSNFTSYTIDGLSPYSDYTIGVKACTTAGNETLNFIHNLLQYVCLFTFLGIGEGMPSSMTQRTLCGRPSEIQNLAVVPNQPFDSLTVTWDEPARLNGNPDSDQYVVRCHTNNIILSDFSHPVIFSSCRLIILAIYPILLLLTQVEKCQR